MECHCVCVVMVVHVTRYLRGVFEVRTGGIRRISGLPLVAVKTQGLTVQADESTATLAITRSLPDDMC